MVLKWVCPKPHGASSCLHTNTNPLRAKNKKQKGEIDVKKVISIALALLMVAVMLPVMAMAEDVNDATTLKAAVANGGEVTLGTNITASITIPKDKTVTLNLNGYKLTNDDKMDTIYVEMGGALTIKGTGTVDNVSHGRAAIFNNGTVILNGGTYTRSAEVGTGKDPNSDNGNSWYTICNHGIMTVNPGVTVTNTGTFSSVFENGYYDYNGSNERSNYVSGTNHANPELTIYGGTFEGGKITIKNDNGGKMTIKDGTFTNKGNRVVYNVHVAVIEGGEFNCPTTYFGNHIAVHTDIDKTAGDQSTGSLTINGGNFDGKVAATETARAYITGGTFNSDVTPYVGDTLVVENNGKYYVGEDAKNAVENATSGTFTVVRAVPGEGVEFEKVNPGVTVKNGTDEKVTVNGNEVKPGATYTVPGAPIIIYTPTEDTPKANDQKNPGTGANDFVGVAAAMAVVSLLGAAAVIRKK